MANKDNSTTTRTFCDAREVYVSVDIEADGPCPGLHSMLSFGAAAACRSKDGTFEKLGTFSRVLERLPGAEQDEGTMEFWGKHPEAYAFSTNNPQDTRESMLDFTEWLTLLGIEMANRTGYSGGIIFVSDPAAFDFKFIDYYLRRFAGGNPFGFSALDLHTLAWVKVRGGFKRSQKRELPKTWTASEHVHDHTPLTDACQALDVFIGLVEGLEGRRR